MYNEKEAKRIIAHFVGLTASQVNDSTVMDYTSVSSSILLHRMYASLADIGFVVDDPGAVTTYGDFINSLQGRPDGDENGAQYNKVMSPNLHHSGLLQIGIDIVQIEEFPKYVSGTDSRFYADSFSENEIIYCESRHSPESSFAGLFSAKEAIIKADSAYQRIPFNEIEIQHSNLGKPLFDGFDISISHSLATVVAVACKVNSPAFQEFCCQNNSANKTDNVPPMSYINCNLGVVFLGVVALVVLAALFYFF